MAAATRTYGGVSAEERRAVRRAALLEAALDLFCEGGWNQVTKKAVCARARLNDRYFYEHFADRDALIEAAAADVTAQGLEAVVTATMQAEPDLAAQVNAAAVAALDFVAADPRRGQLLVGSYTAEVLQRARQSSIRTIANVMSAMTRDALGEAAPAPLDTDMAAYTLVSGTMELVAAWVRGEFITSREHLTALIAAMLLSGTNIASTLHNPEQGTIQMQK
ncbi:TetR/AcrR family transcriptional regulator [Nocardia sp. CA-128927]|uniref:TetR/AcrR family transcriptional regulator n=1 Tax=Nocardia sp. CA-128927 TaxID=3239975 RepID=UPI003D9881A7